MTLKLHNSIPKDPYTKQLWNPGVYNIGQFIACFLSIHSLCDEDGERVEEQVENR